MTLLGYYSVLMLFINALFFVMVTSIQQFIAVFFPLKLKVWVTTARTRILCAGVYVVSLACNTGLFLVSKYGKKILETTWHVTKACVYLIATITMALYGCVLIKFISRVFCTVTKTGHHPDTVATSRTHGTFHNKKTAAISLALCGGAVTSTAASVITNSSEYYEIVFAIMFLQWIVTSVVFIAMNWRTFIETRLNKYCCCRL